MTKKRTTPTSSGSNHSISPFWVIIAIFGPTCLIVAVLIWARGNAESEFAEQIRDFIGLSLVVKEEGKPSDEPAPEPMDLPEPESAVVEAAPIEVMEPEPVELEPQDLSWEAFAKREDLWPTELEITLKQEIPIQFNGESFGHMYFTAGQVLIVDSVQADGRIRAEVNGNDLTIPAERTTLSEWFNQTHGLRYHLADIEAEEPQSLAAKTAPSERLKVQIKEELRLWCMRNFDSRQLEIDAEGITLKWSPEFRDGIFFNAEAEEIARTYLLIQAKHNGPDNYAACKIVDGRTGELLGAGSVYMPSLSFELSTASLAPSLN